MKYVPPAACRHLSIAIYVQLSYIALGGYQKQHVPSTLRNLASRWVIKQVMSPHFVDNEINGTIKSVERKVSCNSVGVLPSFLPTDRYKHRIDTDRTKFLFPSMKITRIKLTCRVWVKNMIS